MRACFILLMLVKALVALDDEATVTNEVTLTIRIEDHHENEEGKEVTLDVALFGEAAPMAVMNYLGLCKGYKKKSGILCYAGTPVHRIVPDFVIQMGDVEHNDGSGGVSIYGRQFDDDEFRLGHKSKGYLAMANTGPDTNGSQFYITLTKARWLDKNHVVFGKVIKGMDGLTELGEIPSSSKTARPKKKVEIVSCEEKTMENKWTMSEEQLHSDEDL